MVDLFVWIGNLLIKVWYKYRDWQVKLWGFAMFWVWLAYQGAQLAGTMIGKAVSHFGDLVSYASGHSAPGAPSGGDIGYWLALGNTFCPLSEAFQYTAAYITFVLLPLFLYRFIKSLIPTMAGT